MATYTNPPVANTYFDYGDLLGSVRTHTRTIQANPNDICQNLPFGDGLACAGIAPDSMHFTDQLGDPDGLTHFLNRDYSTTQGRWVVPDPAGLAASDWKNPQAWNRYAYVLNNPLSVIDPLGLDCIYLNDNNSFDHVAVGDCAPFDNGYYVDNTGVIPSSVSTSSDGSQIFYNWSNPQNSDDAGAGVASTGSPIPTSGSVVIGAPFDQAVDSLGQAGITRSPLDNAFGPINPLHTKGSDNFRDSNPFCSVHLLLDPTSGQKGQPTTGSYHLDLFNPRSFPGDHLWYDTLPDVLNNGAGRTVSTPGRDSCRG